jgi:hypothetical protein
VTILVRTSERIEKLKQEEIRDFLLTFGQECRNNVEYSQWSNELLFSMLDKHTDLVLKTIEKEEKKIEMNEILDDLSSPINDMVNVKDLIPKIEQVKINERLKKEIIKRIKTADSKFK